MEQIGQQKIWSYFDDSAEASPAANHVIRGGRGHCVRTYVELATKVAKLQFRNREHGVWGAMERKVRLATAVSGVSERPELAPSDRFRYGERVASQQVDVLVAER